MFRRAYTQSAMAISERLGLGAFLATWPQGYETAIDDGAYESIPRGIKQRITIARALVTDPRLVLFDEANTAIDGIGDEKLRAVLQSMHGNTTLILISHRPSLLRLADRVFELKGGALIPLK